MKKKLLFLLSIATLLFTGCATKSEMNLQKKILSPESVEIYDISVDNFWREVTNGRRLLKTFPFVSVKPVIDYRGKFSDQFYDKIDYRYKADKLKNVDFWKLRYNPFIDDFIYVLPTWANNFKRISNDLFEDIGYSYNLSSKEQDILKWWISKGGILWIEGGIYATRYDTFKKNGEIDEKAINDEIYKKGSNLTFFNKKVNLYVYKSKKLDRINYKRLKLSFDTKSNINYFKEIKNLKIVTDNYISADFMPEGEVLLSDKKGRALVTFIRYGRGGVVFLRPFEFQDKRFDGELLRWKILYYLLEKRYMKKTVYLKVKDKIIKQKKLVLHNLHFNYKSYKLLPESKKLLKPIARYLLLHPKKKVSIIGYTDNIGSKKYNYVLSLKRAKAVKDALRLMGVPKRKISIQGGGEDNPVASNNTERGRAANRRVEFIFR